MERHGQRRSRVLLLALAAGAAVTTIGLPAAAVGGPDRDLVLGCVWLLRAGAAWLLVAVGLSTASALWRMAWLDLVARVVAPEVLRRVATAAVGSGVLLGTVTTVAIGPAAASTPDDHHPARHLVTRGISLDWPGLARPSVRPPVVAPPPTPSASTAPEPAPSPSGQGRSASTSPGATTRPTPRVTATSDAGPAQRRQRVSARRIVVRPGDSLWSIAAAQLPPDADAAAITSAWHRWWRLNEAVIGADPDVILPGQVLRAPTGAAR